MAREGIPDMDSFIQNALMYAVERQLRILLGNFKDLSDGKMVGPTFLGPVGVCWGVCQ